MGEVSKGRELFAEGWGEERFNVAYRSGFRPKLTGITEEFTFEDFKIEHGEDVVVLMVIAKNDALQINTADFELEPTAGQSVIALVMQSESTNDNKAVD